MRHQGHYRVLVSWTTFHSSTAEGRHLDGECAHHGIIHQYHSPTLFLFQNASRLRASGSKVSLFPLVRPLTQSRILYTDVHFNEWFEIPKKNIATAQLMFLRVAPSLGPCGISVF